jgi:hypothetical protein
MTTTTKEVSELAIRWYLIQCWFRRLPERVAMAIAWRLPRYITKWAFCRVVAHATTGPYGNTEVPALTCADALDRWIKPLPAGPTGETTA